MTIELIKSPLAGVRVVEFGHVAAGPYATLLLADLGADVVKIEPLDGDQIRAWPPLAGSPDGPYSHNFAAMNRGKRSVAVNLKDANSNAMVRRLVEQSDVLVENYRPGSLDRLGFGFDAVTNEHRGLVYCSISGYGPTSPYASDGAYDVVIQAMGGLMSVTGERSGPPVKSGVPVADFVAGLYAALTIVAAIPKVRESGNSAIIECPMLDCLLGVSALQTSSYWGSGRDDGPLGSTHPRNAPYQGFEASDRTFVIAAGSQRLWHAVCKVTGLEHLADDARFREQTARTVHQVELAGLLQERFRQEPAAHWVKVLREVGVPVSLVNRYSEILSDPHVVASGLLQQVEVPGAGPTPMLAYPARIDGSHPSVPASPPRLGADTADLCDGWTPGGQDLT